MRMNTWIAGLVAALFVIGAGNQASAQDSNRNEVRAHVAAGGWEVVWGELVNEAEYAKLTASLVSGTTGAYFSDYLARTKAKVLRTAPEVGRNALENAIRRALQDQGRSFRVGKIGIKAGIATYQRWKRVVVDVPDGTERYKIRGPFGTWTWGYRPKMKRIEKKIPLPNHHQPYIAFRIYPG